jgi:hypothetical protein
LIGVIRSAMEPIRLLWLAVLQQAVDDLESAGLESHWYREAAAFFSGSGIWREARATIADFTGFHPDELTASGLRIIARRRAERGVPAEDPRPRLSPLPDPGSAMAARSSQLLRDAMPVPKPNSKRERSEPIRRWEPIAFDPWRTLPSEERLEKTV